MQFLRIYGLVGAAAVLFIGLFWFRPGGVEGPRVPAVAMEGKGFDHGGLTEALKGVIGPDGRVDYGALKASPGALDRYLGQLRATSPASAPHRFKTDDDRLAYYVNAYNAFVIAALRDRCPDTSSTQDTYTGGGFFWRLSFLMGEEPISLSTLEGELVRGVMRAEPAVHFALVKGAAGFPPLSTEAYAPGTVRAQLSALAATTVKDLRFVHREGEVLVLSQIFEWDQADFAGDPLDYVRRLAPALAEGATSVKYTPFDWSLNGACGPSQP